MGERETGRIAEICHDCGYFHQFYDADGNPTKVGCYFDDAGCTGQDAYDAECRDWPVPIECPYEIAGKNRMTKRPEIRRRVNICHKCLYFHKSKNSEGVYMVGCDLDMNVRTSVPKKLYDKQIRYCFPPPDCPDVAKHLYLS